jgi:hypothetical protein
MITRTQQVEAFRGRARELERRAATTEPDGTATKETLLVLADYYWRLAEQAAAESRYAASAGPESGRTQ